MNRFALAALVLIGAAGPAVSNPPPEGLLDRAQAQVQLLDQELDMVRHPHLRAQLEQRVDRIDRLLNQLERTGGMDGPPRRPGPPPHYQMSFLDYQDMRVLVQRERFDNDKLEVLRGVAGRARLTTDEARALANMLTFDSHKEQALIALYPAVVDKHRYRMALDVLTFSSSRRRVAQTLGV